MYHMRVHSNTFSRKEKSSASCDSHKKAAIISVKSINFLVFMTSKQRVSCEEGTEFLIIHQKKSVLQKPQGICFCNITMR
jgi:hypothetical protein